MIPSSGARRGMSDVVEERRRADVSGGVVVDPQPVYRAAREVTPSECSKRVWFAEGYPAGRWTAV